MSIKTSAVCNFLEVTFLYLHQNELSTHVNISKLSAEVIKTKNMASNLIAKSACYPSIQQSI